MTYIAEQFMQAVNEAYPDTLTAEEKEKIINALEKAFEIALDVSFPIMPTPTTETIQCLKEGQDESRLPAL